MEELLTIVIAVPMFCVAGAFYFSAFRESGIKGKTFMVITTYISFRYFFFYDGPSTTVELWALFSFAALFLFCIGMGGPGGHGD